MSITQPIIIVISSVGGLILAVPQDPVSGLGPGDLLGRDELLAGLEAANSLAGERLALEAALAAVNSALQRGGPRELFTALQHPALRLPGLVPAAAQLYHEELQYIQRETGAPLTYEGVCQVFCWI